MYHNYYLDVVKSAEPFMLDVWDANKICYIVIRRSKNPIILFGCCGITV
jgi:hypothetical protein